MQREPAVTIFERSVEGRRAAVLPPTDVPDTPLDDLIPAKLLRERPAALPEVSEPEIVRHYNRISRRNFDLDTGPYPLGSCTMKHNPRLHERVAALPGHARLHPRQRPAGARSSRPSSTSRAATTCCRIASGVPSRPSCPRSPSRRSSATTRGSAGATSTWTRASTPSARAR